MHVAREPGEQPVVLVYPPVNQKYLPHYLLEIDLIVVTKFVLHAALFLKFFLIVLPYHGVFELLDLV